MLSIINFSVIVSLPLTIVFSFQLLFFCINPLTACEHLQITNEVKSKLTDPWWIIKIFIHMCKAIRLCGIEAFYNTKTIFRFIFYFFIYTHWYTFLSYQHAYSSSFVIFTNIFGNFIKRILFVPIGLFLHLTFTFFFDLFV